MTPAIQYKKVREITLTPTQLPFSPYTKTAVSVVLDLNLFQI